ncbi:MAG: ABC transporter ATP-binding protein [Thermoproteus sp. JCHS_4]|jgi:ABC-type antimicrobial peptide transport system, ATPase component|nr:MAG: ABC transporter ATP-binding protein [Thermoproteus sp. JCHS_4]
MEKEEIRLVDVHKKYRDYEALRGVTLSVPRGSFHCVVGPSGSGKTTLLHIVGGVDRPTKGEVWVAGVRLNDLDDDKLAEFRNRYIGFVFQLFYLIPRMTILENVELPLMLRGVPKAERREAALEALRLAGLGGVDPKRRPTQLSGGEQQRVAIARAIATKPRLLLADEPTGNLDSATAQTIMDTFTMLKKELGITIVMVTHNLELLKYCDGVTRLKDGKIVEL